MNKLTCILLLSALQAPLAFAQVRLNINLHSIEDIRINNISCKKQDQSSVLEIEVESFATQPSFIRYELLQLEKQKSYRLTHNHEKEVLISDESPFYLTSIKAGSHDHHFALFLKDTPLARCQILKESIRLSIEPR